MGLMELGCKLEDFGRLAQPAATNRLSCQSMVVFERYKHYHWPEHVTLSGGWLGLRAEEGRGKPRYRLG